MAAPPPNPSTLSNLLSTHRALLDTLTSFLTVTTHHILYLRRIYPPVSFVSTRAYNYPVRQNRHPDVCTWIDDAVAAVRDQMERNTVDKVSLCIFECNNNQVLERWTFSLHAFPLVAKSDRDIPFASNRSSSISDQGGDLGRKINLTDLEANFRATLSRISNSASKLLPLPEGDDAPECSFTMTIEVKDAVERPVGRIDGLERQWVAAEPGQFVSSDDHAAQPHRSDNAKTNNSDKNAAAAATTTTATATAKTHAVRRLEAGDLRLEVWVEESAVKFSYPSSQLTVSQRNNNASMSYGGSGTGSEKFDPNVGYELEKPNINRRPAEGIGMDYQRG